MGTVAMGGLRRPALRSSATVHVTADREGHLSGRLAGAVASTLADEQVDRSGRRWARLAERLAAPARDDLRRLVEDACDQVVEGGRAGVVETERRLWEVQHRGRWARATPTEQRSW